MNYLIRWIKREYNNPVVFITENGWSDRGELEDDERIEYLHDHLTEIQNVVVNKECNLKGYISKSNVKIYYITFLKTLITLQFGQPLTTSNGPMDTRNS